MLENLTHPGRSQGFRFRRVKSGEHNSRNYKGMDADYLHLSHGVTSNLLIRAGSETL